MKGRKAMKKKPYSRTGGRAKAGTFATRVRKIVLRTCELKRSPTAVAKLECYHNVMLGQTYLLNAAAVMPTGGGLQQTNRIGDQINVMGYKIRCLFGQKGDRPNVNWRFMIVQIPKGGSVGYNDVFKNITGNIMLDEHNTDYTKVLMQRSFRPNQAGLDNTGQDEFTFVKKFFLPLKKTYKFGPGENAITHNQPDIYIVVLAYDAYGTAVTDNIGYCQMFCEMQYKDP